MLHIILIPNTMDENKIKFNDALMPGLIVALLSIAVSLLLQFTITDLNTRQNIGWVSYLLIFGLVVYFGLQYRNQRGDLGLTYGKSFVYLLYIMLISTVISTVFIYVNYAFINRKPVINFDEN